MKPNFGIPILIYLH